MTKANKIMDLSETMHIHVKEVIKYSIQDDNFLKILSIGDAGQMIMYFSDNFAVDRDQGLVLADKFLNDPAYIKAMCQEQDVDSDDYKNYLDTLVNGWWVIRDEQGKY